eukprot:scaffold71645_cov75-Attheya_sp.AAC.1
MPTMHQINFEWPKACSLMSDYESPTVPSYRVSLQGCVKERFQQAEEEQDDVHQDLHCDCPTPGLHVDELDDDDTLLDCLRMSTKHL